MHVCNYILLVELNQMSKSLKLFCSESPLLHYWSHRSFRTPYETRWAPYISGNNGRPQSRPDGREY